MEAGIRFLRSIVVYGPLRKTECSLLAVVSVTEKRPENNCEKPTPQICRRDGIKPGNKEIIGQPTLAAFQPSSVADVRSGRSRSNA